MYHSVLSSFFKPTFVFLTFLLLLNIVGVSRGDVSLATADRLILASIQQIRGVKADLSFTHEGDSSVQLKWDVDGNRVNAVTATHVAGEPSFRIWVRSNTVEWHGQPEEIKDVPDTWYVEVAARAKDDTRTEIDELACGIKFLRMVYTPYHILQASLFQPPMAIVPYNIHTDDQSKHAIVEYALERNNKRIGVISYECDFSDGVRIYSSSFKILDARAKSPVFTDRFEDFEKSNDIWFATHFVHDLFDPTGKVKDHIEIKIKKLDMNPPFKDEDFTYAPTLGSRVLDSRTGADYRAGYKDPQALPGQDERDTRALDAKIKNAKASSSQPTNPQ